MGEEIKLRDEPGYAGETAMRPLSRPPHEPPNDRLAEGMSLPVRIAITVALVALALVSAFFVADWASKPENHATSIESLDNKAETVTGLAAASTAAAGALSLLPGDAGTPIAQKLVDLSSDFLIVMAAIYLEKYLLTLFGIAAFRILVPIALACFVGAIWLPWGWRESFGRLGTKMLLFGIAVALVVPASIYVSDMIERTYSADIERTRAMATELAETDTTVLESIQKAGQEEATEEQPTTEEEAGEATVLDMLGSWFSNVGQSAAEAASSAGAAVSGAVDTLSGAAVDFVDQAKNTLNGLIEALAVLIVTNCVIPILVLLFFVWIVNMILGTSFSVPLRGPRPPRA